MARPLHIAAAVLAVLLALGPTRAKPALDPVGIYGSIQQARRCLDIAYTVATATLRATTQSGTPANCLRLSFHDAATYLTATDQGGANGSILFELNATLNPTNNGLQLCGGLMPRIVSLVRTLGCTRATAADVIQVTALAAVALKGGPLCTLLMGRPDKLAADDTSSIPGNPCDSAAVMVTSFQGMGFTDPEEAVVVLLGAHNIGRSRVTAASKCSRGLDFMTAQPDKFDGHYYTEVVNKTGKKGWFFSDRNLAAAPTTTPTMVEYAVNHTAWLQDWCPNFQEMGLLGVDPAPAGGLGPAGGWLPRLVPGLPGAGDGSALGGLLAPLGNKAAPKP